MQKNERNSHHPASQRLLLRRKLTVAAVVAATFLFLLVYNLGSYFFIKRMGRYLEQSLDNRLKTTASLTAQIIERNIVDIHNPSEITLLRLTLNRIRLENQLEAAYILDGRLNVLLDSRIDLQETVHRGYLTEDTTAINAAKSGLVATSILHTIADDHFKNVYASVSEFMGNVYILALEANADFLQVIDAFQQRLYLGMTISALLLVLLTFFLITATSVFLRTEQRLFQAQRLAYLGQMAATVAHEIRNPLAIIKSASDLLREKSSDHDQTRDYFRYIDDEIRRLNRIVNDFLTFSREPRLELMQQDLNVLLQQTISSFPSENVRISFDSMVDSFIIQCDIDKIRQALMNLLLNAYHAVNADNGQIQVRLFSSYNKGKPVACIEVQDDGPGIKGKRNEIFEPFFTTKSSGTGLGLAVTRQIVEAHSGTIGIVEPKGGGTLMRIFLPVNL